MSVVPLKLKMSVVESQDKFQAGGGFEGEALLVFNLDASQLSDKSSNVSYDLRVGSEYRGHHDQEKTELGDDAFVVVRPGNAVLIQSEEIVFLPRKLFGYIVPKVTLLQKGLTNTISKVDPGYNGPLIVTLFNLGRSEQRLKRRDPFCSLVVHTVEDGATLYNKPGKRITGNPREPWVPRLKAWIESNKTWLNLVVALCSGGLAGAIVTLLSRARGAPH